MVDKLGLVQDSSGKQITLLELLKVLVKRKLLIISVCGVTALATCVVTLFLPNVYEASAKVLPPQKEGGAGPLSAVLSQAGGIAALAAGTLGGGDVYVDILKSRSLKDNVIQRLHLSRSASPQAMDDARDQLDRKLSIQAAKNGIITIAVRDRDPKQAAVVANAFSDELSRTMVRLNLTKAGSERLFLEKRLDVVKGDLKRAEEDLKNFAQQNKVMHVDSQVTQSFTIISKLKGEITTNEAKLAALRQAQTDQSPEVRALSTSIKNMRANLAQMAGSGGAAEGLPSIGSVPALGLEYARREREFKIQENLYEQLTKQYEMAKLTESKDSSSLQVLDEAIPPVRKVFPRRAATVVMATTAALVVSILLAFWQEYLDRLDPVERKNWNEMKRQLLRLR
ncbi:polysaccharide chain length determinant protein [Geomonas sp. Red276]